MAEVTVYHGTSGDCAELIRESGLRCPSGRGVRHSPGRDGVFVTPSRRLALAYAWGATLANANLLGGCLHGALVTAWVDEALLGARFPERLLPSGLPPETVSLRGPAHRLERDLRPDECSVETVNVLRPQTRVWALAQQREVLIAFRRRYQLDCTELAAQAGLSAATIRRFEARHTAPRYATLAALADALRGAGLYRYAFIAPPPGHSTSKYAPWAKPAALAGTR